MRSFLYAGPLPARLGAWLLLAVTGVQPAAAGRWQAPVPAPEFTHGQARDWLNSAPLRLADLRGRVVLVDIWTFDCWNCYRSFPWLATLQERYAGDGLALVGVHSPEYEHEKVRARVAAKVGEFGLRHPVMIDNDHSYRAALDSHYWPAFYLIDRSGRLRASFIGETHTGDPQAQAVERMIEQLLRESGP